MGDGRVGGGQSGGYDEMDTIYGSLSSDTLRGSDDAERFLLRAGGDRAFGEGGNDVMRGQQGRDTLFGGNGNDILAGHEGSDRLTGGNGNDRFVFKSGWGVDRITDFEARGARHDVLDLRELATIANWVDLKDNHMIQHGDHVSINGLRGDRVVLLNTDIADLDVGDFIF